MTRILRYLGPKCFEFNLFLLPLCTGNRQCKLKMDKILIDYLQYLRKYHIKVSYTYCKTQIHNLKVKKNKV